MNRNMLFSRRNWKAIEPHIQFYPRQRILHCVHGEKSGFVGVPYFLSPLSNTFKRLKVLIYIG